MNIFKFIKKLTFLGILFLVTSCTRVDPVEPTPTDTTETLNFYALNDFHGAIENKPDKQTGISRIGKYLMDEKAKNPNNTIIISSGDMWQGSVDSNLNRGALVTDIMNTIGFDSMTIGNHEFDWGEDAIRNNKAKMQFPLLACNIFYKGTETRPDYLSPYTTITKGNIKIGIIGAVKENIGVDILRSVSNLFDYRKPNEYIKKYSDILFTNENCDAVILSTHDGDYSGYLDTTLVSTVSNRNYLDGIFLGHDHQVYNGDENNVPYVEGGSNGKMISHIKLKVKSHKVTESYGEVINTLENCNSTSSEIDAVYDGYKPEIDRIKNTIIGKTSVALSKPELGAIASKSIIYYINNHQDEFNYKVDYAEVNSGGTRNTIEAGNVTYGMIYQVFPFDNNIVEADLDEAGLAAYKSYDGNYSYTLNEPKVDTDGLYHIGTINYISEIYDGKGVNKSRTYSPTLLRDAIVEAISKNYIDEIKPIVD